MVGGAVGVVDDHVEAVERFIDDRGIEPEVDGLGHVACDDGGLDANSTARERGERVGGVHGRPGDRALADAHQDRLTLAHGIGVVPEAEPARERVVERETQVLAHTERAIEIDDALGAQALAERVEVDVA